MRGDLQMRIIRIQARPGFGNANENHSHLAAPILQHFNTPVKLILRGTILAYSNFYARSDWHDFCLAISMPQPNANLNTNANHSHLDYQMRMRIISICKCESKSFTLRFAAFGCASANSSSFFTT